MKDVRRYRSGKERRIIERRKEGRKKRITGTNINRISRGHWRRVQKIQERKKSGVALTKGERVSLLSFYRKSLYHNPTNAEIGMGKLLNILNIKYVFQKQFGHYIVDFYLPTFCVVIEVDGSQHYTVKKVIEYDARRDAYLLQRGLKVLRITNEELINDFISASEKIVNTINEALTLKEKALNSLIGRKSD